jgi:hypothetical protein
VILPAFPCGWSPALKGNKKTTFQAAKGEAPDESPSGSITGQPSLDILCLTLSDIYVSIPLMQTLGLSGSEARTEGRLKSLFWPSIRTGSDLDYLGTQGFWVCTLVAVVSLIFFIISGKPLLGGFVFLFYFLGGVGVRERSQYAAAVIFLMYLADTISTGPSIVKVLFAALLLSNLRATWIASRWSPNSEQAILPPRFNETWGDKIADQLPMWLWPKLRIPYYVLSACFLLLVAVGLLTLFRHRFS